MLNTNILEIPEQQKDYYIDKEDISRVSISIDDYIDLKIKARLYDNMISEI